MEKQLKQTTVRAYTAPSYGQYRTVGETAAPGENPHRFSENMQH